MCFSKLSAVKKSLATSNVKWRNYEQMLKLPLAVIRTNRDFLCYANSCRVSRCRLQFLLIQSVLIEEIC